MFIQVQHRWFAAVAAQLLVAFSAAAEMPRVAELAQRLQGETGEPEALADLIRLAELRDQEGDLQPLAVVLDATAKDPRAREDVKALAHHLRAQLFVAQGQAGRGREEIDNLAPIRAWSVIGPFDNDGRSGLSAIYEPETKGFDPAARVKGKQHEVSWRPLPDVAPLGFVDLDGAVWPRQDVTVYAASVVAAPRGQGAVLHFGASGASKLWVNGELVLEDKNQHPARFDQHAVPVRLRTGDNNVLIKIAHASGRIGFWIRLAGERDEPLPALALKARIPAKLAPRFAVPSKVATSPGAKLPKIDDAMETLRARAAMDDRDARAQEDLAILYATRRPDDDTEQLALHAQERAADAAPGDDQIELRLSRLEERDQNKKRQALERGVKLHPQELDLLEGLAAFRLEKGDGWKALELARQAVQIAPHQPRAQLLEARALDAVGLGMQANQARLAIAAEHPDDVRAMRGLVSAQRRLGRVDEAQKALRKVVSLRGDDAEARAELQGICLDRGDLDGALALVKEAIALEPGLVSLRVRLAELLSQNGRTDDADRAYIDLRALSPDDPDIAESNGRHQLRAGRTEQALAEFDRALSLRPQNPALRDLLLSVKPEERYATPYLYDAAALAAQKPSTGPDEDLEVLADVQLVKVYGNGLSSRTHQVVLRALTQRGVDQARVQSFQFSPERSVVRIEQARIFRASLGASMQVIESRSEGERNLSEPWYGMYYDVRAKVVAFTQLQPGDVFELVVRLDDAGSNYFSDYFGDLAWLQGAAPRLHSDYILLGPPGRTFYSASAPLPGLKHTEEKLPDGGTRIRYSATHVARVVSEPGAPGASELYAWVHVSTYKDWESVGRFYWGLVKDQLRVTDEIRKAADQAVAGIPSSEVQTRIKAVYDYVLSKTRYVALEFGINSFRPYPVETILSRAFGDCKDKASLMHALLEAIGIDSRLVLLRMKRLGNLPDSPASLAVFNHAVLYLPQYDLFLDGTAEFYGSAEMPADDRGADVLIVEPGEEGSRFFRTPDALPQDNRGDTRTHVELNTDGSAKLGLQIISSGSSTPGARRLFESPVERRQHAEEMLARSGYPGAALKGIEVSDPHAVEQPFEIRAAAEVPAFASPNGKPGGLSFPALGARLGYAEALAPLSQRTLPLQLPEAQTARQLISIDLPAGFVATVPPDAHGDSPRGRWALSYSNDGTAVRAQLDLELNGGEMQPEDYPAYRAMLGGLDQALARRVEVGPGAAKVAP